MSTYGELDRTAAASQQAMRSLAHETVNVSDPGEMYWLLGRLNSTVRSLQQVLYQVANAHQDHADHAAAGPDRDAAEGRGLAIDACRQVRRAADLLEGAQTFLDDGQRASGRIVWRPLDVSGGVGQEPRPVPPATADFPVDRSEEAGSGGLEVASRRARRPPTRYGGPSL